MSNSKDQDACPVDHKSREAWLQQARAASESTSLPPSHPSIPASNDAAESCPVDHKSREAWLQQAKQQGAAIPPHPAKPTPNQPPASPSSWSSYLPSFPSIFSSSSPSSTAAAKQQQQSASNSARLGIDREISTIPRSSHPDDGNGNSKGPANQEQETGADAKSGNWIYPSERMFFEAMKRKGHDPEATDMRTVVPIHNAVNERAWAEIKKWEAPWLEASNCGGPRLHSFSGLSTKLSPKARFNTLLGYQAPFDRHDWVVDRCGKEVEYVIDFYTGRPQPQNSASGGSGAGQPPRQQLSFYLDVRPKLNSWEGVKMRAFRATGLA